MANVDLKFNCDTGDGTTAEVYLNELNSITVSIEKEDFLLAICLDKSTAIKFAKTLRTEINKIES